MITHFAVSNFKSIKDLSLDLRKFMVFVGPNGAGKTNLVRALEIFGEVLHRGTVEPIQEHGYGQLIRRAKRPSQAGLRFSMRAELPSELVENALKNPPFSLEDDLSTHAHSPIQLEISIEVTGSVQTGEVAVHHERLRLISPKDTFEIALSEGKFFTAAGSDPVLWRIIRNEFLLPHQRMMVTGHTSKFENIKHKLGEILDAEFQSTTDPQLLHLVSWLRRPTSMMLHARGVSQTRRLRLDASALKKDSSTEEAKKDLTLGPTGEGLASAVAKLRGLKTEPSIQFRKLLEDLQEVYPRVEDIIPYRIPSGPLILLFKEHGISDELGQGNISDGVLHALALLVALHKEPSGQLGVLVIEEPENAIHPWPLRKLIIRAQNSSRQLVLTTHSETVVNAVVDPESLFVVKNDNKKGTIVTPATERESTLKAILEESGQKLGDVWLDGSLGGVPEGDS